MSAQEEMAKYDKICEEAYSQAKKETAVSNMDWLDSPWTGFFDGRDPMVLPQTGVDEATLQHIGDKFSSQPDDFVIHGGELLGRLESPLFWQKTATKKIKIIIINWVAWSTCSLTT